MSVQRTDSSESTGEATLSPWMRTLVEFLQEERQVEALRVNPGDGKVFVATLGAIDVSKLQRRLESLLEGLDRELFLQDSEEESQGERELPGSYGVHLSRSGDEATLEKPSCPTAPKLWKWRDFSWPEPEELEQQSREEWQVLAWQAGICGVALVAAVIVSKLAGESTSGALFFTSRILFIISLVAGAWDAAIDAWGSTFIS